MRRVLLATPSHSGSVAAQYVFSYGETMRQCIPNGVDLRILLPIHDSIIQHARNKLVASAIQHNFDDLIFIDADQDWEPAAFLRLLSHPVDCVGAAVRKKSEERELYNVRTLLGPYGIGTDEGTGLMSAPDLCLGTGFLRFSRLAIETLWASSKPYKAWGDADEYRWIFDVRIENGELISEDIFVGNKLRAAGLATWVDPSLVVGHYGIKRYAGDFANWLAAARSQAQPPRPALRLLPGPGAA